MVTNQGEKHGTCEMGVRFFGKDLVDSKFEICWSAQTFGRGYRLKNFFLVVVNLGCCGTQFRQRLWHLWLKTMAPCVSRGSPHIFRVHSSPSNASSTYIVPVWFRGTLLLPEHSKVGDLKLLAQKNLQEGLPETGYCGWTCPDQPCGLLANCRCARRRAPDCCGARSES